MKTSDEIYDVLLIWVSGETTTIRVPQSIWEDDELGEAVSERKATVSLELEDGYIVICLEKLAGWRT